MRLEAAADRLCVAVLMERVPGRRGESVLAAGPRRGAGALPALPELLEMLEARGRRPSVERIAVEPRRFEIARG